MNHTANRWALLGRRGEAEARGLAFPRRPWERGGAAWGRLAEPARDVGFGLAQLGAGEEVGSGAEFDEPAQVHEGGVVADAGGLLHVVSDDDDRVFSPQFAHQVFHLVGRDWVQGRAGFVEQENFRLGRDGSGDAEPLLLSARKRESTFLEPGADFIPQGGPFEGLFGHGIDDGAIPLAVDFQRIDDVIENAHRKGVGLLKDHAHPFAQLDDIHARAVNRIAGQPHVPLDFDGIDQVVHPVDAPKQGGFAAAAGADDGGDLVAGEPHVDIEQSLFGAIPEIEVLHLDDWIFGEDPFVNHRFKRRPLRDRLQPISGGFFAGANGFGGRRRGGNFAHRGKKGRGGFKWRLHGKPRFNS